MQPKTLEKRVEALEVLPARVDALESQIAEFRAEVRFEFSATRAEMCAMGAELRSEMRSLNDETRAEMRLLHEDVIERISLINERPARRRASAPKPAKR